MKLYKVTMPAVWFEIEAENEKEAKEYFWFSYDQMDKPDDNLIVEEL